MLRLRSSFFARPVARQRARYRPGSAWLGKTVRSVAGVVSLRAVDSMAASCAKQAVLHTATDRFKAQAGLIVSQANAGYARQAAATMDAAARRQAAAAARQASLPRTVVMLRVCY